MIPSRPEHHSLLQTVQQLAAQLDDARLLRRQKSALFNTFEKRMYDDTFQEVEEAICQVSSTAERPGAGMGALDERLRPGTRILYILQDVPEMQVCLTRLGIASQRLNSTLVQLSNRGSRLSKYASPPSSPPPPTPPLNSSPPQQQSMKLPPTYEESQFRSERRQRNMQRRASAMSMGDLLPAHERSRANSTFSLPARTTPSIPEVNLPELDGGDESCQPLSVASPASDYSIPEVAVAADWQYLAPEYQSERQPERLLSPPFIFAAEKTVTSSPSSTPSIRRLQGGRLTGRARSQSWLEARALR